MMVVMIIIIDCEHLVHHKQSVTKFLKCIS